MSLPLAWYGDDFTGASDTLATLAGSGLRAVLFPRVPTAAQIERAGSLDALGVAGIARALPPDQILAEVQPVAKLFSALNPEITHYKCCSTFDSTPDIGNLAAGLSALRSPRHGPVTVVIGGQPSLGRYCAFSELYATASEGGEVHRIDRHPTMSRHPVTPMYEADLRRHLKAQGLDPVLAVDLRELHSLDDARLASVFDARLKANPAAILFDAVRSEDLTRIGQLLWREAARHPLLTLGASSVAQALIACWPSSSPLPVSGVIRPAKGPVFLLAGSLSPVTAAQLSEADEAYEKVFFDAASLVGSDATLAQVASDCAAMLRRGLPVIARPTTDVGPAAPPMAVAEACGRLLARVLTLSPEVRRVGVAGGDTSSFALRKLSPRALRWSGSLAPGVPLLLIDADNPEIDGIELMLKGGQMGPKDVFLRLLRGSALSSSHIGTI
jgi:uncharacterized protein YgbK (DUF1537 family)